MCRKLYEHSHRDHRTTRQPRIQVRLRHRRRERVDSEGSQRGRRPADLGEEERAGVAARVAPEGVSPVADDERADLAERQVRPDQLPGHHLLLGAEEEEGAEQPGRSRSGSAARPSTSSASRSTSRRCFAGVAVDAVFDSVSVATTFREKLGKHGDHLHVVLRGGARAPGAGEEVSRLGRAAHRQLLRRAELRGLQRRLVRLRPQGRALPDGAVDLLPHQREGHRAVRADADHRRRGLVRQLPRRLHRADARREPAARGGRRAGGARRRDDQVFDDPELVPRRQGRQGGHLQLRDQARARGRAAARRSRGRRSRPARRSPGSIPAASSRGTARSASSTRWRRPTTGSRPTPAPR